MRMRAVAMFGVMAMPAGVDASRLPSDDKAEWERMEGKHPGWFPNRDIRDKVLILHGDANKANVEDKKKALREVARAAQAAAKDTQRLQTVISKLSGA